MSKPAPCRLDGMGVLVTRPTAQADALCEAIADAHGRPIRFATLEITPTDDPSRAKAVLAGTGQAQLLIFVSANAVGYAMPLLPDALPIALRIAAVGRATAKALNEAGLEPDITPDGSDDSEGLLQALSDTDINGWRIIIVRGNGGREHLQEGLSARGASVEYAEVYHRGMPRRDPRNLIAGWNRMIDAVTLTSVETLDNLRAMLGDPADELLGSTPLLVASQRIAERARALGYRKLHLCEGASDAALLDGLCSVQGMPD